MVTESHRASRAQSAEPVDREPACAGCTCKNMTATPIGLDAVDHEGPSDVDGGREDTQTPKREGAAAP